MNWLDQTIAAVAPRTAVKRAAARFQLDRLNSVRSTKKRYASSEYDTDWEFNTATRRGAMPLRKYERQRIRKLVASNPYAGKALQTLQNNLIGYGITGTPVKGTPKKVIDAWAAWQKQSDYMRELDFFGQQDLSTTTMLVDGEAFIVRRFEKGSVVPTRLQILDGEMLASGIGNGGRGIDYDLAGRPLRYHFRPQRGILPSIAVANVVTFDAKDVIHIFRREYVGQMHGRSFFEAVVKSLTDLNDYFDAEIVRKKIEACFAAFITPSADYEAENGNLGAVTEERSDLDFNIEAFEPGMIERLRPGDDIKFGEPKAIEGIREFTRAMLLGTTAGVGIPYEHGTGDLSQVNYSSYKAGSLEFQRFCGRLQWLLIIPRMLDRVWQWFLEDGYQTGMFARADYAIAWTPAAFESIDRKKDAEGIAAEEAMGLTSRRRLIGERGYDYEQEMRQMAADAAFEAELGLSFETKPPISAADAQANKENDDGN